MKLRTLMRHFPDMVVRGSSDVDITDICSHSQLVVPGSLFIARKGAMHDGNVFVQQAVCSGAAAVLSDLYNPLLQTVTQIITPHVREAQGKLAAVFWNNPADELHMVGITGTSGKTTTSYLISHLFDYFGIDAGRIGSVTYSSCHREQEAERTTPDVCVNHKLLRDLVSQGATACVMEVSSHALDQGRVDGIAFDTAIFTNLTHEHLDYHKTFEQYMNAKRRLFNDLGKMGSKRCFALINGDDRYARDMVEQCTCPVFTYGIDHEADVQAERLSVHTRQFSLCFRGERADVSWSLEGRFNVENGLAAAASFLLRGYTVADVAAALSCAAPPPGRLESIANTLGVSVYVDYAHKPDALQNVLKTLRNIACGRLILVFGCGGDRDKEKRPLMGAVAERYADHVVVTSDNPRSENPRTIVRDIVAGFTRNVPECIENRREAIARAIALAKRGDIVLIAGKGHERTQQTEFASVACDDRVIARECCEALSCE